MNVIDLAQYRASRSVARLAEQINTPVNVLLRLLGEAGFSKEAHSVLTWNDRNRFLLYLEQAQRQA